MDKYILKDKKPVLEPDLITWAKWFETANRTVAKDTVGGALVSTVFLGMDHNYQDSESAPILFETMVFDGDLDILEERYRTWDQAVKGHASILEKVKKLKAQAPRAT